MKLVKNFPNNDIYFMEVVSDRVVLNDNYNGILILDNELNILTSIKLPNDTVIDTSFIKEKEIILYCYENHCFIYLNVETYAYKIIPLITDLFDISFLSLYEWVGNDLILLADAGTVFVHVNVLNGEIYEMQKETVEKPPFSIYDDWKKLSGLVAHKIYSDRRIAIIEANNDLGVMNYKTGTTVPLNIERIDFHDIELTKDCVVQVSEVEISVLYGGKNVKLYPLPEEYRFLRCKILVIDGIEYLLLLACSNADSRLGKLERYSLETDLFSK